MKLTIILTVYNKEPYLRRAFDSLLNQDKASLDEYEILAVDDGSTDKSSLIIEEYSKRNQHIRVLTQENQGLSMARNNGVNSAEGEYVWFVDADDVFSPNAVRLICDTIDYNPDIIPIYAQTYGVEGIRNQIPVIVKTGVDVLLSRKWQPCGVFNVFRKGFLKENNLTFLPGIYHEDSEFTPRALYAAKSAKVIPEVLYTVIHEPNSITDLPKPKRAFDYLVVANSLCRFVKEKGEANSSIGKEIYYNIAVIINNGLSIINKNTLVSLNIC